MNSFSCSGHQIWSDSGWLPSNRPGIVATLGSSYLASWYCCTHGPRLRGLLMAVSPSSLQSIFRHWGLASREQVSSPVPALFLCIVTKAWGICRNGFWWATNSKQQLVSYLCFVFRNSTLKKFFLKKNVDSYLYSNFLAALFSRFTKFKNCLKENVDSHLTFSDLSFGCFCFLLVYTNCTK